MLRVARRGITGAAVRARCETATLGRERQRAGAGDTQTQFGGGAQDVIIASSSYKVCHPEIPSFRISDPQNSD